MFEFLMQILKAIGYIFVFILFLFCMYIAIKVAVLAVLQAFYDFKEKIIKKE